MSTIKPRKTTYSLSIQDMGEIICRNGDVLPVTKRIQRTVLVGTASIEYTIVRWSGRQQAVVGRCYQMYSVYPGNRVELEITVDIKEQILYTMIVDGKVITKNRPLIEVSADDEYF